MKLCHKEFVGDLNHGQDPGIFIMIFYHCEIWPFSVHVKKPPSNQSSDCLAKNTGHSDISVYYRLIRILGKISVTIIQNRKE